MIIFQNISYKIRELNLPKFGDVLISTTSLIEKLFDLTGKYVSEEALLIDEQIFYFVEECEIDNDLSILTELLLNQVK
jgi:hypothetical protein